ncbi:MAG: transketolase [Bacteroidales bacterium]|jgi:transketolase|nr:transketolase [Bacteroidales bacterium]MBO7647682.1 transketolase [Bacteroidales bacterium]MCR4858888.1 transketolase [Bacteroidales bacterium]
MNTKDLENIAAQVRRDIIRMVHGAKSGHPGGSLGCADFMTALYFQIMEIDPTHFTKEGVGEDMFFLSNGHISPVLYSVMARRGYFPVEELGTFRKLHTRLQGHPTPVEGLPGIRVASGSLGQGVSVAIGAALAKKANKDPHLVFALTGDGELQEGQVWEAFMFGGAKKVDNLIVTIDYNGKQIDGPTDVVMSLGKLRAKLEAFGWMVLEMDGNDMKKCVQTLTLAKTISCKGKPIAIVMKTEMGKGVDFMMGTHKWHGTPPNDEQAEAALAQLPVTLGDY